eukprot:4693706-Pleurochrysis_carterae.AAC.1
MPSTCMAPDSPEDIKASTRLRPDILGHNEVKDDAVADGLAWAQGCVACNPMRLPEICDRYKNCTRISRGRGCVSHSTIRLKLLRQCVGRGKP